MEREQVKEIFKVLAFAYPKFEVSSDKIDFWHKFLIDQNPATVMRNVERYVMEKPFPPSIADIREQRVDRPQYREMSKEDMIFG
jgi:hypothetical protein